MATFIPIKYFPPSCASSDISDLNVRMTSAILTDQTDIDVNEQHSFHPTVHVSPPNVYKSYEEAQAFLIHRPVQLMYIDIGMAGTTGIEALIALRNDFEEVGFCLGLFEDSPLHTRDKNLNNMTLEALRSKGIPARETDIEQGSSTDDQYLELMLSPRKKEILILLAQGLLYKEISQQLGITLGTVKQHITKIYHILDVNNRTEAVNMLRGDY